MLTRHCSQQNRFLLFLLVVFSVFFIAFKWPFHVKISRKSEKCLVYSFAFPSAGGPGCSLGCIDKKGNETSTFGAVFYNNHKQIWPEELVKNMELAASILETFGQPQTLNTEGRRTLHVAFDYYCCYTEEEGMKIMDFLNGYSWKPHEVWFDQIECAINGYGDAVSIVLMVDKKSQEDLTQLALKNERDLEVKTAIHKHIPHTRLRNFHMTLGTVDQSNFPVQSAVEEINRVIPPGEWHKFPVILARPRFIRYH